MRDQAESDWASVSDLARLKGVNKAAISRRVTRLEAQGLLKSRRGARGAKLIDVAEFDRVATETTDGVRELNGRKSASAKASRPAAAATHPRHRSETAEAPPPGVASHPVLSHEQARRAAADAALKELDLEERLGRIAPLDRVRQACLEFAQTLARVIDRRPSRVDDIIAANSKGGLQAARVVEKDERRELRAEMARAMDKLADEAEGAEMADVDDRPSIST